MEIFKACKSLLVFSSHFIVALQTVFKNHLSDSESPNYSCEQYFKWTIFLISSPIGNNIQHLSPFVVFQQSQRSPPPPRSSFPPHLPFPILLSNLTPSVGLSKKEGSEAQNGRVWENFKKTSNSFKRRGADAVVNVRSRLGFLWRDCTKIYFR